MATNQAQNEELVKQFRTAFSREYESFKAQREDLQIDETMKVADGMWRCYRNRDLADTERKKDNASRLPQTRSHVGSPRFRRHVLTGAGIGTALTTQSGRPWSYKPRRNPEIYESELDGKYQATIFNILTDYSLENGKWMERAYDFWTAIKKSSNVAVFVHWRQDKRRIGVKDATGKLKWEEKTVAEYPDWELVPWRNVFASCSGGNLDNQRCVIILKPVPWAEIQQGVKNGWYDKESIAEIVKDRQKYIWDTEEGHTDLEYQIQNEESAATLQTNDSDVYLKWEVYRYSPIKGGKWDDEADYALWWWTGIGNTPENSKCVRLTTDFSPSGKIPGKMIYSVPDDAGLLYHNTDAQAIRALYSTECTITNQLIDMGGRMANPPWELEPSALENPPDDDAVLTFEPGQHVKVKANRTFAKTSQYAPNMQPLIALWTQVRDQEDIGMGASRNRAGQSFGGRTSASEALMINRYTEQPADSEYGYIATQFFGFLAEQFMYHWMAFGDPTTIKVIADDALGGILEANGMKDGVRLYGIYDISLDVVEGGIKDYMQAQQELQLFQAVTANPSVFSGGKFKLDPAAWLYSILKRLRIKDISSIVVRKQDRDAVERQRSEIEAMKRGEIPQVDPMDDHETHYEVCRSTYMQLKPFIDAAKGMKGVDPETGEAEVRIEGADWIENIFLPHMRQHEQLMKQEQSQQAQQAQAMQAPQTPAQQQIAPQQGQMGAMLGG